MRRDLGLASVFLIILLIAGCAESSSNSDAPAPGRVHEPGWRFTHDEAAQQDIFSCQVCHGENFQGNPPAPACTDCHIGGPPFLTHPPSPEPALEWRFPVNHGSFARLDIQSCQGCHGQPGGPGSNPRFNVFTGPDSRLEAGCESALGCHDNNGFENGHNVGAAHPVFDPNDPSKQDLRHWYGERIRFIDSAGIEQEYLISHYNAGNLGGACTLCHGATLAGGVGPACTSCHAINPAANQAGCVSCHGDPLELAPADFIERVERTDELEANPTYQTFIAEVTRGFHLQHDSLSCQQRDTTEDCRLCHINTETGALTGEDPRTNVNRHHLLVDTSLADPTSAPNPDVGGGFYDCLTCHTLVLNPETEEFEFAPFRDCAGCHTDPFPPPEQLPCAE